MFDVLLARCLRRRRTPCSGRPWPARADRAAGASTRCRGRHVVAIKLVRLAVLLESPSCWFTCSGSARGRHCRRCRWSGQQRYPWSLDRRDRRLGIELLLADHHAARPRAGAGVDIPALAGIDEGMPAARARADRPTLPLWLGCARIHFTAASVSPTYCGVGNAAIGAHLGGDVVGIALARTLIEVGADREIAGDARSGASSRCRNSLQPGRW